MKTKFFITSVLILLILSSCNYFKNHRLFSKSVDSVLDMTIEQPLTVVEDTAAYVEEEEYIQPVIEPEPEPVYSSGSDKYFMIVGSFQNQNLANSYSSKIQGMGYSSQVIEASNGYFRVSAKSYPSFQQGINEIDEFRSSLSAGAWLHVVN